MKYMRLCVKYDEGSAVDSNGICDLRLLFMPEPQERCQLLGDGWDVVSHHAAGDGNLLYGCSMGPLWLCVTKRGCEGRGIRADNSAEADRAALTEARSHGRDALGALTIWGGLSLSLSARRPLPGS